MYSAKYEHQSYFGCTTLSLRLLLCCILQNRLHRPFPEWIEHKSYRTIATGVWREFGMPDSLTESLEPTIRPAEIMPGIIKE